MPALFLFIVGFIACVAIIVFSGSRLSGYGDKIAALTGMGRAWVGLIVLAAVTSLPELITGISSVAIVKSPDLAAGDLFGSCVFNLLILSILDTRIKKPLFSTVKSSHIVAAIFGIILLTTAGIAIHLSDELPQFLWISSFSFLLFGLYLFAVWGIFTYENNGDTIASPPVPTVLTPSRSEELKSAIWGFSLHAMVVVAVAVFLPYLGAQIAAKTGLGNSFFGTLFIAAATSLPELVVSLAAIRMGALDLAVGNLLGSNVFNMFILSIDDIFYREGSLFAAISKSHLLSVFITIIMTAVVGLSLVFKPNKKLLRLIGLDTFIILVLYLVLILYLFFNK